jgi:hypothetical protein
MATHRDEVLRAFGLGPADLEANRSGGLSTLQKKQLFASGVRNLVGAVFGCVVLLGIMAFVVNRPLKPAQIIMALILGGALMAVGIYDLMRTRAAAGEGVERFSGPVQVVSRGKQGWWLLMDRHSFRMPVRPWKLENGSPYHVYWSRRANRIVSMEPADDIRQN